MFESLVSSALLPPVLELLRAADKALDGVKGRLTVQLVNPNHITALAAEEQLKVVAVWQPAIKDLITALDKSHIAVHGRPLPGQGGGK